MHSGPALRCYASWMRRERRAPQERCVCACVLSTRGMRTSYILPTGSPTFFLLVCLASHRVIRPITAGRARMALIPRARHAHLLRAPSAPRSTQRRTCARRFGYSLLRLRLRRRTNPVPVGIDSCTRKERPALPSHVARALHDARAMCDVLHGAIAFARQGGLLSRSDAAHGWMWRCRLCSQAGRRQPPFRDWAMEDGCGSYQR